MELILSLIIGIYIFSLIKSSERKILPLYMHGKYHVIENDGFFEVVDKENYKQVYNRHNNKDDAVEEVRNRIDIGSRKHPVPQTWHYCIDGKIKTYCKLLCSSGPRGHGIDFDTMEEIKRLTKLVEAKS